MNYIYLIIIIIIMGILLTSKEKNINIDTDCVTKPITLETMWEIKDLRSTVLTMFSEEEKAFLLNPSRDKLSGREIKIQFINEFCKN